MGKECNEDGGSIDDCQTVGDGSIFKRDNVEGKMERRDQAKVEKTPTIRPARQGLSTDKR